MKVESRNHHKNGALSEKPYEYENQINQYEKRNDKSKCVIPKWTRQNI